MTNNKRTDLDIAKDLEQLSSIVNESIERADNVLKKAQEIDEVKALIQEIYAARKSLESNQNMIQELEKSVSDKLIKSQIILNQLTATLEKTGEIDEIQQLLIEIRSARVQLKESTQEIINVRSLENYLQEFKKNRNHKQFRQWLWQELGIIGILIYFLSLITPKNSQRSR